MIGLINEGQRNSEFASLRYKRFVRLSILGSIALVVPYLIESYLGRGALPVRGVLIVIISIYCIHIFVSHRHADAQRKPGIAFAIILLLLSRPFVELIHGELEVTSILGVGATTVIVWALWSLRPEIEWFRVFAVVGLVLAILALIMAIVTPQAAFMITELGNIQGGYKSSSNRGLLAGPFSNANTLGIVMASSIPFVFLWRKISTRCLISIPILVALWLSVSRTSLIASGIVLFLTLLVFNRQFSIIMQKTISLIIVVVVTAIQMLWPFVNTDQTVLTGRGEVWMVDIAAWQRNPWFGNGDGWYAEQDIIQSGIWQVGHSNSHNTFLGWLTFGGLFYFACCAAIIFWLIRISLNQLESKYSTPILFTVVLLIVGISESHWHLFSTSPVFFMQGFLIIGIMFTSDSQSPQGPATRELRCH